MYLNRTTDDPRHDRVAIRRSLRRDNRRCFHRSPHPDHPDQESLWKAIKISARPNHSDAGKPRTPWPLRAIRPTQSAMPGSERVRVKRAVASVTATVCARVRCRRGNSAPMQAFIGASPQRYYFREIRASVACRRPGKHWPRPQE